jgi:nucleoside-diphosphate-sugar epimerase
MAKKIIVTGCLGYIGHVLLSQATQSYNRIAGIDLDLYNAGLDRLTPEVKGMLDYFPTMQDIPSNILKDVTCVVHLAGVPNDAIGNLDFRLTHLLSHESAFDMAKLAKSIGIPKFIFASSCAVYGKSLNISTEQSAPTPKSSYAISKLKTEKDLENLSCDNFQVYLLRLPTIFGWSAHFRNDLVVNELITKALSLNHFSLDSNGQEYRPFMHIEDLARAIFLFIDHDVREVNGLPINIGFDCFNLQIVELAQKISNLLSTPLILKDVLKANVDDRDYKVSFALFNSIFPYFRPLSSLDEQIEATAYSIRNELKNFQKSKNLQKRLVQLRNQMLIESSTISQLTNKVRLESKSYGLCCKS